MDLMLPAILLLGLLLVWTYLPFLPALRELQEKKDIEPVRVVRDSEVDIHYFARGYRNFIREHLAEPLEHSSQGTQEGRLEDGTPYIVLGPNGQDAKRLRVRHGTEERMVLSSGTLLLPANTVYRMEIYGADSVGGGEANVYRGILAENRIELSPKSTSLRWMHAGRMISVSEHSWLHGRVSADERIELADRCHFERLNAPRITFGGKPALSLTPANGTPLDHRDLENVVDVSAGRWLCKGRMKVPAGRTVEADLVSTDGGEIGEGTWIAGSVKCHKDLRLGRGVVVDGSVVAGRDLHLEAGCRIRGPVLAEREIVIERNCEIGSLENPTTVSARRIRVEPHVLAHGSVWAHQEGRVGEGASEEAEYETPAAA